MREIADIFSENHNFKKVAGAISDIAVSCRGSLSEVKASGKWLIKKLSYNNFSIHNTHGDFNFIIENIFEEFKLFGGLILESGSATSRNTLIDIEESRISFSGNFENPSLDFKGTSIIEGTEINIRVQGPFEQPQISLLSKPPYSQERLFLMLATGKAWKSLDIAESEGEISSDLAWDFMDYFIFDDTGNKLAEKFGLSNVSFKYNVNTKGVSAKKRITDKAEISYSIEQSQMEEQSAFTAHKVGAGYKITKNISIETE